MGVEPSLRAFLDGTVDAANFRHADHVRAGFEILRHHDFPDATAAFARSLKQIAARAGAADKYHETITLAFLSLIAERRAQTEYADFESFAQGNPDLMDASVLKRWYAPDRLMSAVARKTFVLPNSTTMSETWALRLLRWSYCAFIAWASVRTFVEARAGHDLHALALSGVEIAAIAAFLFPPLEVVACAVLLVVYTVAAVLTAAAHQDVPLRFIYFAMTAAYIVIADQRRTVSTNA